MKPKNHFRLAAMLLSLLFVSSCSKDELVEPEAAQPSVAFDNFTGPCSGFDDDPHIRYSPLCSFLALDIRDNNGSLVSPVNNTDYGSAEIFNSLDKDIISISTNFGWYVAGVWAWRGDIQNLPMAGNQIGYTAFPIANPFIPGTTLLSSCYWVDLNDLVPRNGPCDDYVIRLSLARLNFTLQPVNITTAWISGTPHADGYSFEFCPQPCSELVEINRSCDFTLAGVPGEDCANLTVQTTGISGALTYQWSNGATTPSIQVCPSATTTYSVTVTTQNQSPYFAETTVNVLQKTGCGQVILGVPGRECATIGFGGDTNGFLFNWSSGNNNASETICPTAAVTTTVTVTSAATGCQRNATFPIGFMDARCGNDNSHVKVCRHLPNNNTAELCLPLGVAQDMVNNGDASWGPCNFTDPCQ